MVEWCDFIIDRGMLRREMSIWYDKEENKVMATWDTHEYYTEEHELTDDEVQELIDFAEFLKEIRRDK